MQMQLDATARTGLFDEKCQTTKNGAVIEQVECSFQ